MRNLLEIETGLLDSDAVSQGLQLTKVKSLQKSIKNAERTKFRKQLDLALLMRQGKEWFDKAETQLLFSEQGIVWSAEELADKVFECTKSWMYKCIKASSIDADVVDMFENQCRHLQESGERVKISIEELNRFAKAYAEDENVNVADLQSADDSVLEDTTADDSILEDTTEDTESTSDTIFTMCYKTDNGNIVARYSATDGFITHNTADEIRRAIAFLSEQLD
jgi:hypothetical protein